MKISKLVKSQNLENPTFQTPPETPPDFRDELGYWKRSAGIAVKACLDCLPSSQHQAFKVAVSKRSAEVGIVDAIDETAKLFKIHAI